MGMAAIRERTRGLLFVSGEDPARTVEIALVIIGFGGDQFADDDLTSCIRSVNDFTVAQINGCMVGRAAGIGVEVNQITGSELVVGNLHEAVVIDLLAGGILQLDINLLVAPVCKADAVKAVGTEIVLAVVRFAELTPCALEELLYYFIFRGTGFEYLK